MQGSNIEIKKQKSEFRKSKLATKMQTPGKKEAMQEVPGVCVCTQSPHALEIIPETQR